MDRKEKLKTRRLILKTLVGVPIAGMSLSTVAGNTQDDGRVPIDDAKAVVSEEINQLASVGEFTDWTDARPGKPTTFYMPTKIGYEPSAYLFPIKNRGNTLGFITASARSEWASILHYGTGEPPTSFIPQAQNKAKRIKSKPSDRLIYMSGLSYRYEIVPGTVVNLIGLQIPPKRIKKMNASDLQMNDITTQDRRLTPDSISMTSGDSFRIWGVDKFTEHGAQSDNSGSGNWPGCIGTDTDPWNNWDGCIPYAAAMALAYHEGINWDDWWQREALIDRMHHAMHTTKDGWTLWKDIDYAINHYTAGSHDYAAHTPQFLLGSVLRGHLHDHGPVMLNMNDGGGKSGKTGDNYGDHSVTVVGYEYRSSGFHLAINDGWSGNTQWLQWGNWGWARPTYMRKD